MPSRPIQAATDPHAALPSSVDALLSDYGAAIRRGVDAYCSETTLGPTLGPLMADYPGRGGKGLRPTLLIATAKALGGRFEEALPVAVALEILHNAQLVHDDIEDESLERRGTPALHVLHGSPQAMLAGDGLAFRSLRPLVESRRILGPRLTVQLLEETGLMMNELVAGQALDLGWRIDNVTDIDASDYLQMVLQKTCWPSTIYPLRVGALIGGRGNLDLTPLIRFGFFLGAAFQIQDDLLNLMGRHDLYGKELNGDLWEGKRTLMSIRLLEQLHGNEHRRLVDFLGQTREQRSDDEVQWVRHCMEAHHCLTYAREFAHGLAGAALAEFENLFKDCAPSPDLEFIGQLVHWVLRRSR